MFEANACANEQFYKKKLKKKKKKLNHMDGAGWAWAKLASLSAMKLILHGVCWGNILEYPWLKQLHAWIGSISLWVQLVFHLFHMKMILVIYMRRPNSILPIVFSHIGLRETSVNWAVEARAGLLIKLVPSLEFSHLQSHKPLLTGAQEPYIW